MDALERHARSFVETALAKVTPEAAPEIYVASLFVYDEDDDPERPTATVGFNTEEMVASELEDEPDEAEVRWNYAYWLQNDLGMLADPDSDPAGAALRDEWVAGLDDPDEATEAFVELLVRVVQSLHADGVVDRVFGRPIPVLIHELEYYDEIAEQNARANPGELAGGLRDWIEAMG
jgi:hypothetical protein